MFHQLGARGFIEATLAARLVGAVGLRNRLAHAYGEIQWALVYDAAGHAGDLNDFVRAISPRKTP